MSSKCQAFTLVRSGDDIARAGGPTLRIYERSAQTDVRPRAPALGEIRRKLKKSLTSWDVLGAVVRQRDPEAPFGIKMHV